MSEGDDWTPEDERRTALRMVNNDLPIAEGAIRRLEVSLRRLDRVGVATPAAEPWYLRLNPDMSQEVRDEMAKGDPAFERRQRKPFTEASAAAFIQQMDLSRDELQILGNAVQAAKWAYDDAREKSHHGSGEPAKP